MQYKNGHIITSYGSQSMFHLLATFWVLYQRQNFQISFNFIFDIVETRMLLSAFRPHFSLFLVSFPVKFPHWLGGALSRCELSFDLALHFPKFVDSCLAFGHDPLFLGYLLDLILPLLLTSLYLVFLLLFVYHCWIIIYEFAWMIIW